MGIQWTNQFILFSGDFMLYNSFEQDPLSTVPGAAFCNILLCANYCLSLDQYFYILWGESTVSVGKASRHSM